MADDDDVVDELEEKKVALDDEEEKILRELRELETGPVAAATPPPPPAKAHGRGGGKKDAGNAAPLVLLNDLLSECEKEVRDAKGYVAEGGPPLRIVRCKPGEAVPRHATFLSRPKDTGVDFTVPVKVAGYSSVVKHPVTLNQIRDRCRHQKYESSEAFVEEYRLLARNTAAFNTTDEVQWIVQHANLLAEAAEDAVHARVSDISAAEAALVADGGRHRTSSVGAGKRKRDLHSNGVSVTPRGGADVDETPGRHTPAKRGRGRTEPASSGHVTRGNDVEAVTPKVLERVEDSVLQRVDHVYNFLIGTMQHSVNEVRELCDALRSKIDDVHAVCHSMSDDIETVASAQRKLAAKIDRLEESIDEIRGEREAEGADPKVPPSAPQPEADKAPVPPDASEGVRETPGGTPGTAEEKRSDHPGAEAPQEEKTILIEDSESDASGRAKDGAPNPGGSAAIKADAGTAERGPGSDDEEDRAEMEVDEQAADAPRPQAADAVEHEKQTSGAKAVTT